MDTNPKVMLSDGNYMPLIGLGLLNLRANDKTFNLNDFLVKAANIGYTHFDVTNNELALGEAFKGVFEIKRQVQDEDGQKIPDQFEAVFPRQNMFISYKVYNTVDIEKNIKTALQALKLSYFDLVMLNCPHSPPPAPRVDAPEGDAKDEPEQPKKQQRQSMKKAWQILEYCKQQNLVRSIGVANFSTQALLLLYPFVKSVPVVNQVQSHPYLLQKSMVSLCKKLRMTVIAYCPLLRGGKDQKGPLGDKIDYLNEAILKKLANKYGKTVPQIILNYQICRGVAVIPKTEKAENLNDNFNITDFAVLDEDIKELQTLDKGNKVKVYQLKNLSIWRGEDPLA